MTILSMICIALCLGILTGYFLNLSFIFCIVASGVLFVCSSFNIKKSRLFAILILVNFYILGIASTLNKSQLSHNDVSQLRLSYYEKVLLKGVIVNDPNEYRKPRHHQFILEASSVKIGKCIYKIKGLVLVKSFQTQDFVYGQEIIIRGGFLTPNLCFGNSNFNYRLHLRTQGIEKMFCSKKQDYIKTIGFKDSNPIKNFAFSLKNKLNKFIRNNLEPTEASILIGLLFGDREYLSKKVKDAFVKTGTVHILAISGFNVGIVAFMLLILLKALNIKFVLRHCVALLLIIFYAILTGLSPSVVRSTIMISIYFIGLIIQREGDLFNCLAVAAILILVFNPLQIFNISFQLSFISVFSICFIPPRIKLVIRKEPVNRFLYFLVETFTISISAWIGTWMVVVYYFRIVSPITVLANLFIVPYTSLVTAAGFSLIIFGRLHPLLANPFAATVKFSILVLLKCAEWFSQIPFAYFYVSSPSLAVVLAYYVIVLSGFCFTQTYNKSSNTTKQVSE